MILFRSNVYSASTSFISSNPLMCVFSPDRLPISFVYFAAFLILLHLLFVLFRGNPPDHRFQWQNHLVIFLTLALCRKHHLSVFNSANCFHNHVIIPRFTFENREWIKKIYLTRLSEADTLLLFACRHFPSENLLPLQCHNGRGWISASHPPVRRWQHYSFLQQVRNLYISTRWKFTKLFGYQVHKFCTNQCSEPLITFIIDDNQ